MYSTFPDNCPLLKLVGKSWITLPRFPVSVVVILLSSSADYQMVEFNASQCSMLVESDRRRDVQNGSESRNDVLLDRFCTVRFEVPHLGILGWTKRLPISRLGVLLHEIYLPIPELVQSVGASLLYKRVQIWLKHFSLSPSK
jgi:hypothetical protein